MDTHTRLSADTTRTPLTTKHPAGSPDSVAVGIVGSNAQNLPLSRSPGGAPVFGGSAVDSPNAVSDVHSTRTGRLSEFRGGSRRRPEAYDLLPPISIRHGLLLFSSSLSTDILTAVELPDPSDPHSLMTPGVVLFRLQGGFQEYRDADTTRGHFFRKMLAELGGKWGPGGPPTIMFPAKRGRTQFAEITFKTRQEFFAADYLYLRYNGKPVILEKKGPPMPRNHVVVKLSDLTDRYTVETWGEAFRIFLSDYCNVLAIWAIQTSHPEEGVESTFTGVLFAQVEFPAGSGGLPEPQLLYKIPGWLVHHGKGFELAFEGRFPYCALCGHRTRTRHEYNNCPRRLHNHRGGHDDSSTIHGRQFQTSPAAEGIWTPSGRSHSPTE